jgi:predicted TIM-barrel fold metal-dependent hydrolase
MNSAVKAVAASGHLAVNQTWLDLHIEMPLDPQYPIIDPHHHLWDAPKPRYLLDEVLADFRTGHNVVSSVFVECRAMYRTAGDVELKSIGETKFADGIAAMSESGVYGATRVCEAIVGYVDLRLGDRAKGVLEKHLAVSDGRLRGIRNIVAWDEHPEVSSTSVPHPKDLLENSGFRAGFDHLGRLGLVYDCWLYQSQLTDLTDFAKAFPKTTIVIDHLGGPLGVGPYAGRRQEAFAEWRTGLRRLAELPNTVVKIGGLGMRISGFGFHQRSVPPSSEDLADTWRNYIHEAIATFGARRCMFESNSPVDKGSYGYGVLWNAFKRLTADASADKKADLFHGTAARTYGLSLPVAPQG